MDRALPGGGGGGEMNVLERQLGSAPLTNNKWQPQQLQLQELQSLMLNDSSNHSISQTKQFLTRDIGDNDVINKYENLSDARSDRVVNCSTMTKINNLGVGLDHQDNLLSSGSLGEFIQLPRIGFDGVDAGFVSIGVEKAKLAKGGEMDIAARMAPSTVVASEKKRKTDTAQYPKVVAEEVTSGKKIKRDAEEVEFNNKVYDQAKTNMKNRETSADTSSKEETSKATSDQVQKPDYIHVRARRGQATDSHSLAERMRREKISARMKYLQDLVPGCNKIIGKAGMLDEIINYVQSLQRQVEFLSMKLATINSTLDFNVENFFTKEAQIFPTGTENYPPMGILSEIVHPAYLQFNPSQRVVSCSGLEMTIDPSSEITRGRTSIVSEEASMGSSCFTQAQPSSTYWETDCQGIYSVGFNQRRLPAAFPSQQFTGLVETNNLMMMKKM